MGHWKLPHNCDNIPELSLTRLSTILKLIRWLFTIVFINVKEKAKPLDRIKKIYQLLRDSGNASSTVSESSLRHQCLPHSWNCRFPDDGLFSCVSVLRKPLMLRKKIICRPYRNLFIPYIGFLIIYVDVYKTTFLPYYCLFYQCPPRRVKDIQLPCKYTSFLCNSQCIFFLIKNGFGSLEMYLNDLEMSNTWDCSVKRKWQILWLS